MRHAMHRASITPAFLRRLAAAHGSGASPPCSSGNAMMPPDDTALPAILPETPAAGSAKFSEPVPAGAAAEDVRGTVKLAESRLGRSRVGRVNGRDEDASRPDLRRPSLPR